MMNYEIQTDKMKQQMLNKGYSINKLSKESYMVLRGLLLGSLVNF